MIPRVASQASSAGYARYPNEGSQVFIANNQAGYGSAWDEGSYSWQTLLHETAHALGLKHPGNYNAGGGGTPGPQVQGRSLLPLLGSARARTRRGGTRRGCRESRGSRRGWSETP